MTSRDGHRSLWRVCRVDPAALPYMVAVLAWQWIGGVILLIDAANPAWEASLMLYADTWQVAAVGAMLLAGASLALYGLHPRPEASRSWTVEILGHLLLIGATGTYAQQSIDHYPAAVFNWSWPLALIVASALRIVQIVGQDRIARGICGRRRGGS